MNLGRRAPVAVMLVLGTMSVWQVTSPRLSAVAADTDCMGLPATITGQNDATPGDGKISGTDGNDVILGTEGNDTIEAGAGDDRICGLGGDDNLTGGDGFDRENGGPGQDTCDAERQINCEVNKAGPAPAPPPQP
jgi:RTX calcium-binding nonapeptide repeat (4 copies)